MCKKTANCNEKQNATVSVIKIPVSDDPTAGSNHEAESSTARPSSWHANRSVSEAERQIMRDMRAAGASNGSIARATHRSAATINREIGRPAPRPPASTPRGLRKKSQKAQASGGRGDELRPAMHGYALPAGSALSWGAISSEPYPAGGSR